VIQSFFESIQRISRLGQALGEDLRERSNVSQLALALEQGEVDKLQVVVPSADGEKC